MPFFASATGFPAPLFRHLPRLPIIDINKETPVIDEEIERLPEVIFAHWVAHVDADDEAMKRRVSVLERIERRKGRWFRSKL